MSTGAERSLADLQRGMALTTAGRYKEAAEVIARYVGRNPDDAAGWIVLARCSYHRGEPERARTAAQEAVRLWPEGADGHMYLALSLNMLGRTDEAPVAAREAVRLYPHSADKHWALAEVLMSPQGVSTEDEARDRLAEALNAAEEAVRLSPEAPAVHRQRAVALAGLNRHEEALAAMRGVIELDPTDSEARAALVAYRDHLRQAKVTDVVTARSEALADAPHSLSREHHLNASLHRLVRRSRWIALGLLVLAVLAADVFVSPSSADAALPAPLGQRLVVLGWMVVIWGLIGWLTFRRVPRSTWRGLWLLCRRSWLVRLALWATVWCTLGTVLLTVVPWTDRSVMQWVVHATWVPVVIGMYFDHGFRKLRHPLTWYR